MCGLAGGGGVRTSRQGHRLRRRAGRGGLLGVWAMSARARRAATPPGDRKIGFALVGCGRISGQAFRGAARAMRLAPSWSRCATPRPEAACRRDRGDPACRASHRSTSCSSGSDADVIVLATPSGLHAQQAIAAAAAGRHVLTEKPMATRWEDGQRMVAGLRRRRGQALRRQAEPAEPDRAAAEEGGRRRAASAASSWSTSTCSGRGRRATTTAPRGAAPGSSTAAPS